MKWREKWMSPRGAESKKIEEVVSEIKLRSNVSIFVGCDSHTAKGLQNKYLFAITICILSDEGNTYFYSRGVHNRTFKTLKERLTEEVAFSSETAVSLMKYLPDHKITLHADSSKDSRNKSALFTDMFRSWAHGIGCEFASKPDAWASSSIADKHAK